MIENGHENIYKCTCKGCSREYKSKFSLNRHLITHMSIRSHCCPYCSKRFTLAQYLREHICLHTGNTPYICKFPGCGKRFRQSGKFSLHKRTHYSQSKPMDISFIKENEKSFITAIEFVLKEINNFDVPEYVFNRLLPIPMEYNNRNLTTKERMNKDYKENDIN